MIPIIKNILESNKDGIHERSVLFASDEDEILGIFPLYNKISDSEFKQLVDQSDSSKTFTKEEFCLLVKFNDKKELDLFWFEKANIDNVDILEKQQDYNALARAIMDAHYSRRKYILNNLLGRCYYTVSTTDLAEIIPHLGEDLITV